MLHDVFRYCLFKHSIAFDASSSFNMPLEATMMIIDNSEYMRNGDYQPTRFEAQSDAVNTVFQTKIDSNPENTVGIMSMAGKG
jgi:26S proteasome regulatory subunit N10